MLRANEKPETRTIRFDMDGVTIEDIVDIAAGSARRDIVRRAGIPRGDRRAAPIFWTACCAKTGRFMA